MKKLFCLLSSNRFFTRLLLILAAAIVVFAVAADVHAQRTRTGGASGTGSDWTAVILLGDEEVAIIAPSSVCGSGFFDAAAGIAEDQAVSCTFTDDFNITQEAQCFFDNLQCSCFQEGKCTAKGNNSGTRTSTMTCPTTVVTGGPNVAGCTGTVTIKALDGTVLALDRPIGEGLSDLNTNSECGAEFPASFGLRRSVMGTITQSCTAGSIAADDRVLQQVVRSTNDYLSTTEWLDLNPATCNPNNGFPTGACQNDGGAWITFAAAESGVQCVADNFSCGQLADDGSSGPPPSVCRVGSSGQCECRCARCTPEGTLVNLGAGDQGKFVVASSNAAFACDVTVTGN